MVEGALMPDSTRSPTYLGFPVTLDLIRAAEPPSYPKPFTPDPNAFPEAILEAVERMNDSQRARLAELLGLERRHRLLYLPSQGVEGGFVEPMVSMLPPSK
jgi:hypothetical protein